MDGLMKKMPILALIFLILVLVYAVKYRSIQGFSTAVAPPSRSPSVSDNADAELMKYYEDIISPLGPALYNTVRPIQKVIQSVAGAAEPIYAVGEAYKNVIKSYLESDTPKSVKPIMNYMKTTHENMREPVNTLQTMMSSSISNKVYIVPILHRELARTFRRTVNTISRNPNLLSKESLKRQSIFPVMPQKLM
jgi:hypothetical protein